MLKTLFAPGNDSFRTSLGLLALRLWLGLTMLLNHGLVKLHSFSETAATFPDPLGAGQQASVVLALLAEIGCSLLLVLGLATRLAALMLAFNMTVAFFAVHHRALSGEHSGELAFIYLAGYVALMFAGGGKLSVDKVIFAKKGA